MLSIYHKKMNQKGNSIIVVLAIAVVFSLGGYLAYRYFAPPAPEATDGGIASGDLPGQELPAENQPVPGEPVENVNSGELVSDPEPVADEPIAPVVPAAPIVFNDYPAVEDASAVAGAANRFGFELYRRYGSDSENVFFSSYSIAAALGMVYEGARGKTAEEIASVFHFPADPATRLGSFAKLYDQINPKDASYQLSTANALWAQKDYPFDANYLKTIKTYYGGGAQNLDFKTNAEGARKTINGWVSDKTAAKIPELFAPGSLNEATRLVLANAVYFKGKWYSPFQKTATQAKDFTRADGSKVQVSMMTSQRHYGYAETADYQAISIPYEKNDLSMLVILPQNGKMAAVETGLSAEKFVGIKHSLVSQDVQLFLPKFKFDTDYNMNKTLAAMGMPTAFNAGAADFTGMYDKNKAGGENLYIGLVIHKAYIDVNEEGTEAAAATGVAMQATSAAPGAYEPPKIFNADHPFIFAIVHNSSSSILFMGKVNDPAK